MFLPTSEEKNWLESREKPIRFTPCPDYPPLDFIDTNHEHSGLSYDYLKLIEKKIDYKFSIIEADSWSDLTEKYKTGKIDFVSSIHKNPEREKYLNFTDSYIKVKAVFITRKNFRQKFISSPIEKIKVTITKGYAVEDYLLKKHPHIKFKHVDNEVSGLMSVSFHETDVMVADIPIATYYIEKEETYINRYDSQSEEIVQWKNLGKGIFVPLKIINIS